RPQSSVPIVGEPRPPAFAMRRPYYPPAVDGRRHRRRIGSPPPPPPLSPAHREQKRDRRGVRQELQRKRRPAQQCASQCSSLLPPLPSRPRAAGSRLRTTEAHPRFVLTESPWNSRCGVYLPFGPRRLG